MTFSQRESEIQIKKNKNKNKFGKSDSYWQLNPFQHKASKKFHLFSSINSNEITVSNVFLRIMQSSMLDFWPAEHTFVYGWCFKWLSVLNELCSIRNKYIWWNKLADLEKIKLVLESVLSSLVKEC